MNLIDLAIEKGLEPKKNSSRGGGEYHCACPNPGCDADDNGFMFWPFEKADKCMGLYWCRKCNSKGDAIKFCREFLNLSWNEALQKLSIPKFEFQISRNEQKLPEKHYKVVSAQPELWQQKASTFVDWCHNNLLRNKEMLSEVQNRGLTIETIKHYKIGFNPGEFVNGYWKDFLRQREEWGLPTEIKEDGTQKYLRLHIGITIPTFQNEKVTKIKIRRTNYEKEIDRYKQEEKLGNKQKYKTPKYLTIAGSKEVPSIYGNTDLSAGIVIESEFDGILIQQFASDLIYSVSLGGSRKPIDFHTHQLLQKTPLILLSPDVDSGGSNMVALRNEYRHAKLWASAKGKSAGDSYKYFGIDLRQWILEGFPLALKQALINKT